MGQGTSLPRVVLSKVSGREPLTLDGPIGGITGRIQVDVYGDTLLQAILTMRQVHSLLSGYKGGPVLLVSLDSIRDGQDVSGGNAIPRESRDYAVKFRI